MSNSSSEANCSRKDFAPVVKVTGSGNRLQLFIESYRKAIVLTYPMTRISA